MKRLEDNLQKCVVSLLEAYKRTKGIEYFAVPNGGYRHKTEAARLKATGVRAGVPDLVVLIPAMGPLDGIRGAKSKPRTLFLELKAGKNKLQPSQLYWADWLKDAEFTWAEIRSVTEVDELLKSFTNGQRRAA